MRIGKEISEEKEEEREIAKRTKEEGR